MGQHFIGDKSILKKIFSLEDIEDKIIFEIGPGQGALTKEILQNKPKKLILIEKDKNLITYLSKLQEKFENIIYLIDDDILNINLKDFNYNKVKIIAVNYQKFPNTPVYKKKREKNSWIFIDELIFW